MARSEIIEFLLRVRGAGSAQRDLDKTSRSVKGTGQAAKGAGAGLAAGAGGLGKFAVAAGGLGAATFAITSSVRASTDLARATMMVTRATGMDTKQASLWAGMTKTRGIETKQLTTMFNRMNRSIVAGRQGTKSATDAWQALGVSQEQLKRLPTEQLLMRAADGIAKLKDPAARSTAALAIFGRQGGKLLPLLASGSAGIRKEQEELERLGAVLGSTKDAKAQIAAQRTFQRALLGLQVAMGKNLMPAITSLMTAFGDLVGVFAPVLKNTTAMKILVGGLTAAFVAYKTAVVASTIATSPLGTAFAGAAGKVRGLLGVVARLGNAGITAGTNLANSLATNFGAKWKTRSAAIRGQIGGTMRSAGASSASAFGSSFAGGVAAPAGGVAAKTGRSGVHGKMSRTFRGFGKAAGFAFSAAFVLMLPDLVKMVRDKLTEAFPDLSQYSGKEGWGELFRDWAEALGRGISPGGATGGTITHGGNILVGEAGPEVVKLPHAAQIVPLGPGAAAAALGGGAQQIVTQVFLDRRQIAEAVGSYTAGRVARS